MRGEILLILLFVVGLIALTAIRYRKQIAGIIGVARMLTQAKKAAKGRAETFPSGVTKPNTLVNCSKCNIWVPQDKAVKFRDGFICSTVCLSGKTPEIKTPIG